MSRLNVVDAIKITGNTFNPAAVCCVEMLSAMVTEVVDLSVLISFHFFRSVILRVFPKIWPLPPPHLVSASKCSVQVELLSKLGTYVIISGL